ncbi:CMRF35-like molecule 6 [Tupaia chinensis]|uniref:CMRF35-like molecule 6 n=1 Tax=Tupaia chinensis TaxID=246437 RepID=L9KZW8_TUPCH|nr:CMRF35-like molecule 6 [Tupaia chinensis]
MRKTVVLPSGCFSLSGPSTATGTVGGSLSLQFRYQREFQADSKYWCRKSLTPLRLLCDKIVEIRGSQLEVRRGRVSIRDHPASLTFTVTLENLKEEDAGTYWSAIDRPWDQDTHVQVVVSVYPVLLSFPQMTPETLPLREEQTQLSVGCPRVALTVSSSCLGLDSLSRESPSSRALWDPMEQSLVSIIHFVLLVFLKLPLLLGMLSAVLWVNRPQRTWGRQSRPDNENQEP